MSLKLRVWEEILSDTVVFELFSSSFTAPQKTRVRLVRHRPQSPQYTMRCYEFECFDL